VRDENAREAEPPPDQPEEGDRGEPHDDLRNDDRQVEERLDEPLSPESVAPERERYRRPQGDRGPRGQK
jgi:hypothetical protein